MGNTDRSFTEVNEAWAGDLASNRVEMIQEVIQVDAWRGSKWLWHGFSARQGNTGELNLGFTAGSDRNTIQENRARFVEAVTGSREARLVTVSQVHSNRTVVVTGPVPGVEADGLITNGPGILLGILTADCVPVLVADTRKRVVGAFHAGWRGTVERVVELGIQSMCENFRSEPGDLMAAIGPRIGPCCYSVGAEVRERFEAGFDYAGALFTAVTECGEAESRLDLVEANRRQLLAAGLQDKQISSVGGCTVCHPEIFYSHRGSGGRAGRMMAVIGIR